MTNTAKIIFRVIVVIILVALVAGIIYYFINRNNFGKSSFTIYSDLIQTQEFKSFNKYVEYDSNNELLSYGNGLGNSYKIACCLYGASWLTFETLATEFYFVKNTDSEIRSVIDKNLTEFTSVMTETLKAIEIFRKNKSDFGEEGNDLSTAKGQELKGQFQIIEQKLMEQAKFLVKINETVFPYVVKYSLGGSTSASLKYSILESIYRQCALIASTVANPDNYTILQTDLDKMVEVYNKQKSTNFYEQSDITSKAYSFLKSFKSIDKDEFFGAINKGTYYSKILTPSEQVLYDPIYEFFSLNKGDS